jgi:hypothetical protein
MYRVLRVVSAMLRDIGMLLGLVAVVVALVVLSECWCAFYALFLLRSLVAVVVAPFFWTSK